QLSFLVYIGDHPNCSPTELANAIDADSGYTTRSVKKLVASGMAIREKHKDDGRAYVLRLTSLGMEKAMAVREMYASWEEEVTCDLDEDEREALLKILSKLGRV
ncbi:MAG: MarR family winged helix-turn-helix transcriptional regulator, partial [Coriobacteriales bacterium]